MLTRSRQKCLQMNCPHSRMQPASITTVTRVPYKGLATMPPSHPGSQGDFPVSPLPQTHPSSTDWPSIYSWRLVSDPSQADKKKACLRPVLLQAKVPIL